MKFKKLLVLSALWLAASSAMAAIVDGVRVKPTPSATQGFVASEDVEQYFYLYNVDAQAFFTEGNAWGTQVSLGATGLKAAFTPDGDAFLFNDFSNAKNAWKLVFFDNENQMFVDLGSQANYRWGVEDNGATFRLYAASEDNGNPGSLVAGVVMSGGTLINCTVAGNVATNATVIGRGLAMSAGRAVNNIVWGNSAAGSEYSGISITGGTFNTNLVESAVSQGTGNFVAHPRFRRLGANYILRSVSPAINAGDNGVWASLPEVTDITGRPRLATAKDRVDLGCYECDKTIANVRINVIIILNRIIAQ